MMDSTKEQIMNADDLEKYDLKAVEKMKSKNFYWWLVAVVALVASVINAMFDQWFVSGFMVMAFILAGSKYFKYRREGK